MMRSRAASSRRISSLSSEAAALRKRIKAEQEEQTRRALAEAQGVAVRRRSRWGCLSISLYALSLSLSVLRYLSPSGLTLRRIPCTLYPIPYYLKTFYLTPHRRAAEHKAEDHEGRLREVEAALDRERSAAMVPAAAAGDDFLNWRNLKRLAAAGALTPAAMKLSRAPLSLSLSAARANARAVRDAAASAVEVAGGVSNFRPGEEEVALATGSAECDVAPKHYIPLLPAGCRQMCSLSLGAGWFHLFHMPLPLPLRFFCSSSSRLTNHTTHQHFDQPRRSRPLLPVGDRRSCRRAGQGRTRTAEARIAPALAARPLLTRRPPQGSAREGQAAQEGEEGREAQP